MMQELEPEQIIPMATDDWELEQFHVGFTGGSDSGIVADWMSKNHPDLFKGCIYADTGIGTNKTKQFVIEYCEERDWDLVITHPKKGDDFKSIVRKYGFPSISVHDIIMRKLKIIPIRDFLATKNNACLVSGVRKDESDKRFINAKYEIHKDHCIFVSPMLNKSNEWMHKYFFENGLKKSPTYQDFHISGDCLCGCFSQKTEVFLICGFYPELKETIQELELELKDREDIPPEFRTWGNQHSLLDAIKQQKIDQFMPLCSTCITDRTGN